MCIRDRGNVSTVFVRGQHAIDVPGNVRQRPARQVCGHEDGPLLIEPQNFAGALALLHLGNRPQRDRQIQGAVNEKVLNRQRAVPVLSLIHI